MTCHSTLVRSAVAAALCVFAISSTAQAVENADAGNWPRFRGPLGTGVSSEAAPTRWTKGDVEWQTDLPAEGHSSPIVWRDRIFLTGFKQVAAGVERRVLCLDRNTGKVLWNCLASTGEGERIHKMNSWATPSCATDGELVFAFFGSGGIYCFRFDGAMSWSRKLGDFPGSWGVGASPVLYENMVIQNCDAAGESYIIALDKKSGETVWKTPRLEKPRGGWSTPVLIETEKREELLVNGEFGVQAYDPKTGDKLWFCKSFNGRGTPSPVLGEGVVVVVNGKPGDVYAIKPGGSGDVTNSRMQWHTPRSGARDLPSPTYHQGVVFVPAMNGVASCYDAKSGKEHWKKRLGGNFSASPVAADGHIYALAENGDVYVLDASKRYKLVARNSVSPQDDEIFRSSMAISRGQILLRSNKRIYCIGESKD